MRYLARVGVSVGLKGLNGFFPRVKRCSDIGIMPRDATEPKPTKMLSLSTSTTSRQGFVLTPN